MCILELLRQIDSGHAASTQFAFNEVAVWKCGGQPVADTQRAFLSEVRKWPAGTTEVTARSEVEELAGGVCLMTDAHGVTPVRPDISGLINDPLEFLARVLVHIPDEGHVTTRYDGWTYLMNFVDDGRLVGLKEGRNGEELPVVYRVFHPTTMLMEKPQ